MNKIIDIGRRMAKVKFSKIITYLLIFLVIVFYSILLKNDFISTAFIDLVKKYWDKLLLFYREEPAKFVFYYTITYIISTLMALPIAVPLTLTGGMILGFWQATCVISFAATFGAGGCFLLARFLLRNWVETRFKEELYRFNQQFKLDGGYYLFSLRLAPVFPFFLINLLFGITQIRFWNFLIISYFGMLPGTLLYVNAATEISRLDHPNELLSPHIFFSLVAAAVLPLILKRLISYLKKT